MQDVVNSQTNSSNLNDNRQQIGASIIRGAFANAPVAVAA